MGLLIRGLGLLTGLLIDPCAAQEVRKDTPAQVSRQMPEALSFAHGLFRQRRFDLAADEYQRFLDSRPSEQDAAEARFGLANAWLFQGRYKEARSAFHDFLEKTPDHPRARTAWYRLGELAYMLSDLPECARHCSASSVVLPSILTWRQPGPILEMCVWDWKTCPRPGLRTNVRWPTFPKAS